MPPQIPFPGFTTRQWGIAQILLSGFCFGFLGLFGKWAFSLGLDTGAFLSLRFLLASAMLFAWLLLKERSSLRLGIRATATSLALGVFGYALFSLCYFSALRGLSVSLTVLLLYTYPVWVALGGVLLFRERLLRAQLCALPLAFGGLALLLWGEMQVRDPAALGLGLMAALLYSAYILASRSLLKNVPAAGASFFITLGAGIALAVPFLRELPADAEAWAAVGSTALVGTMFAISLFLAGLQKLQSTEASILSLAEPCTAVAAGALLYGERLSMLQWIGVSFIVLVFALVALAKGPEPGPTSSGEPSTGEPGEPARTGPES